MRNTIVLATAFSALLGTAVWAQQPATPAAPPSPTPVAAPSSLPRTPTPAQPAGSALPTRAEEPVTAPAALPQIGLPAAADPAVEPQGQFSVRAGSRTEYLPTIATAQAGATPARVRVDYQVNQGSDNQEVQKLEQQRAEIDRRLAELTLKGKLPQITGRTFIGFQGVPGDSEVQGQVVAALRTAMEAIRNAMQQVQMNPALRSSVDLAPGEAGRDYVRLFNSSTKLPTMDFEKVAQDALTMSAKQLDAMKKSGKLSADDYVKAQKEMDSARVEIQRSMKGAAGAYQKAMVAKGNSFKPGSNGNFRSFPPGGAFAPSIDQFNRTRSIGPDDSAALRSEIEQLRAEIEQLRAQLKNQRSNNSGTDPNLDPTQFSAQPEIFLLF